MQQKRKKNQLKMMLKSLQVVWAVKAEILLFCAQVLALIGFILVSAVFFIVYADVRALVIVADVPQRTGADIAPLINLDDDELNATIQYGQAMLTEMHPGVSIARVVRLKDRFYPRFIPRPGKNFVNQYYEAYSYRTRLWNSYLLRRRKRLARSYDLVHYMVPGQLHDDGKLYFGGLARKICGIRKEQSFYRRSIGNYGLFQTDGEPRFNINGIVVAHEIGHLIGAEHTDPGPNVMHFRAHGYAYTTGPILPVLPITKAQVANCVR